MKIFGWVQRKLSLSSSQYCRVSDASTQDVLMGANNGGKNDMLLVAFDGEKDALLLHQTLGSMLSVGTLGHASLFCTPHHHHQQQQQEDDQVEPPAKERAREHSGVRSTGDQLFLQPIRDHPSSDEEAKESAEPLLKESKERGEERRTTLADLFAEDDGPADVDRNPCKKSDIVLREQKKWKKKKAKNGMASPPTAAKTTMAPNKLQLITRMLKKKVHPDVVLTKGVSEAKWDGAAHEEEMTKLEANAKAQWLKDVRVSTMEMW